jgi:hypothetical protein
MIFVPDPHELVMVKLDAHLGSALFPIELEETISHVEIFQDFNIVRLESLSN